MHMPPHVKQLQIVKSHLHPNEMTLALLRNKLDRIDDVILFANKAKNIVIA